MLLETKNNFVFRASTIVLSVLKETETKCWWQNCQEKVLLETGSPIHVCD
jgi:hypothetical protein